MRIFHEPTTIMAAAAVASAATTAYTAHTSAQEAEAQAEAEALSRRREIRDEREERKRQIARTRALLSGGGTDIGTILSLTGKQMGESMIREHRIRTDSRIRQRSLRARARNERVAGFMRGGESLLSGGVDIARHQAGQVD